jgi:serine/threonine protein kinase/Tol biopolymer transport system component
MAAVRDLIGSRLGPYEIIGRLGAGGMGEVYRARDPRLHREVAIKILPQSAAIDTARQRRFAQEAIAAGALNHSNILVVYDIGDDNGTPYIVSELIEGSSLRDEMDRGRLPIKRLLSVGARIADGLAAAHSAGIVHRDIKPENVMEGRDGRIKIVDFGLAQTAAEGSEAAAGSSNPTQTAAGLIIGTVPYMSPEQAAAGTVDFRSDQFSLGVMLHEMATGVHPFRRATPVQTLAAIIGDDHRPIEELNPLVPPPLRWVIDRCLAKDPRGRYAHTADLAADLEQLRDRLAEAVDESSIAPGQRGRRRWFAWAASVAATASALIIGATLAQGDERAESFKYVPLATDAGYQGQPAWSPDGKTLGYVADVDGVLQIFTRSLTSVLRTQVTHARFDCHDPFWSHDGSRLYFHSLAAGKDSLWSISSAGGPADVVIEGATRAAISADGRSLAVFREDEATSVGMSLWIASPPTVEPTKFARGPLDQVVSDALLRYSPDGSKLLVWVNGYGSGGQSQRTQFVLVDTNTGTPRPVLPSLSGPRAPPLFTWLADNRHIVLVRNDGQTVGSHLWIGDLDADRTTPLTLTNGNESSPAIAPDSMRLAFTSEATDFDLVLVPIDQSPPRTFLSSTRNELDPAWSPTGAQYAYVSDRNGSQEIWVRSEEGASERGGFERPLVTDADFPGSRTMVLGSLAFSHDGLRLAYQRFADGGYRIWISTLAGGTPVPLTASDVYQDGPSWSPDGESVAYISGAQNSTWSLAKIRVGAPSPTILKQDVVPFARPEWSPDGSVSRTLSHSDWIAYAWGSDATTVYGLRTADDPHHFLLAALDVSSGKETIVNGNLGTIPQANQPIRGFTRIRREGFLTSVARVRSDIWLLEGFRPPARGLARLWPFKVPFGSGRNSPP